MFAEELRKQRMGRKMSQVELARALGITKQSVSNWENDNIMPSIETLMRIAAFFGVTTDCLLGLEGREILDVTGFPQETVAHLRLLVNDLRRNTGLSQEADSGAVDVVPQETHQTEAQPI